jgi:hypothetical protein
MRRLTIIGFAFAAAAMPALAVDGGIGRTLTGTWVLPSTAVVGPAPGFGFTTLPIGYMGAMGGDRLDPVGGSIVTNDESNGSVNVLIPRYVYKTETTKVSFASACMIPVSWWGGSSHLQVNGITQSSSSANASVGDVNAIPLTVGFHFSENNNLSISTWFFAPTGLFRPGNLSNVGMGVWTVMPNLGHTYYWKKANLEFDNFVGFDIYSHNALTNYTSGTMFHWDGMAIKYFGKKRFGVGAIGANQTQITNDRGPLADLFHGFEGRKWGVGPTVLYVAKAEKPGVTLHVRWINEFKVTNMLKGNVLMAGIGLSFN